MAERGQQLRPGHRGGRRREKNADGTGGQSTEALGRSRGGFGTKIHAAVSPLGHPVTLELTGSAASDSPRLPGLIAGIEAMSELADKGYDSDAIRAAGAEPRTPPWRNRKEAIPYDRHLYRERNVVERYFARIKHYRRVATRYDKKAVSFLGFVWVTTIAIMLASFTKQPSFNQ